MDHFKKVRLILTYTHAWSSFKIWISLQQNFNSTMFSDTDLNYILITTVHTNIILKSESFSQNVHDAEVKIVSFNQANQKAGGSNIKGHSQLKWPNSEV